VHVWRRLRGLGALYLQQSVCLLPAQGRVTRQVQALLDRVRRDGGSGRLLHITLDDAAERAELIEQFRTASDAEYADVLERIPAFLEELAMEQARGRATFVEVEENEADLARFRSWLSKIEARDYFGASLGERARTRLTECEQALELFATRAFQVENGPASADGAEVAGDRAAADLPESLLGLDEAPAPHAAPDKSSTRAAIRGGAGDEELP
jgi:hypothetical protein